MGLMVVPLGVLSYDVFLVFPLELSNFGAAKWFWGWRVGSGDSPVPSLLTDIFSSLLTVIVE